MARKEKIEEALNELEDAKAMRAGQFGSEGIQGNTLQAIVAVGKILGEIALTLQEINEWERMMPKKP